MYYLLFIVIFIVSIAVQFRFRNRFRKYAEIAISSGMSGAEVATRMLHDYGIRDVEVISVDGQLTDHYNPENKTVNLSADVYHGRSIAAAAIASHECGHAVQHATAYSWLSFRSSMVPMVSVASNLLQWVLFLGVLMLAFMHNTWLLAIGVGALAIVTLFSFITLPVEFDASNRALLWLEQNPAIMQHSEELTQAKDALKWAAMTYVVAALSSLAMLLQYGSLLFGGSREE